MTTPPPEYQSGQQPYRPVPYQHSGGSPAPYGYAAPRPPALPPRVPPWVGWILIVTGALTVIGSFMPWATALGGMLKVNGTDGGRDGWLTFITGLATVGLGIRIGVANSRTWAVVAAVIISAIGVAITLYDMNDVSGIHAASVDVGSGLVLVTIASVASLATSLVGCFARTAAKPT